MYESPITMYIGQMREQIEKQETEQLLLTVNQSIGFDVNKEELIKALQYDREQYNKGFSDCKSYMLDKVKQAINEVSKLRLESSIKGNIIDDEIYIDSMAVLNILDKLIAESEEK